MKKMYKSILSMLLVLSMLLCATVSAFAAEPEEYICELRLIYAEDLEEAKDILADSEFSDYKLLPENLNEDTGEIGVWLAYKTTTNIDDAITDLAVMQMNGGYTLGNYQEMIEQSYEEYIAMGEIYLTAIDYFIEAYNAGHFLAESAFRQLNFYAGLDDHEDERLGDVFLDGIDEYELATMFLQGNSYVLKNVRSLIAMGVSYNDDEKTYLQKVGEEAAAFAEDPDLYENEDYEELAFLISPTINVFREMLKELAVYEDELNYADDALTSLEIKYMEYKAIATMLREIEYLGGKTLYQFCLEYEENEEDYSALYPLVAALNEGQIAMTKVAHYYDVVRYSMGVYPEQTIDEQITKYEEKYEEKPFDIYTGVDRSIYKGSFALTTEAERGDAYNETSLVDAFFGDGFENTMVNINMFMAGAAMWAFAIDIGGTSSGSAAGSVTTGGATEVVNETVVETVVQDIEQQTVISVNEVAKYTFGHTIYKGSSYQDVLNTLYTKYAATNNAVTDSWGTMDFSSKYEYFHTEIWKNGQGLNNASDKMAFHRIDGEVGLTKDSIKTSQSAAEQSTQNTVENAASSSSSTGISLSAGLLYLAGGILMLYSAFRLGKTVYDYYHPKYEDVPIAMVDLVETVDGDRFIKYDVVYNAETNKDGVFEAADLNAFEAQRWNALYYTKSYEAGKPLLADAFSLSTSSSKPKTDHTPVHRFGEVVCYNLNKYNFDYDTNIYLSVKQSKNNKSAVEDVPEVIGSMIGTGFLFLAGGIGAALGVGGTFATQSILKKKKAQSAEPAKASEED